MENQTKKNNELIDEWYICAIAFLILLQAVIYYLIIGQKSFAIFLEKSGTASPIFLAAATLLTHIGGYIMFFNEKRRIQREKYREEGRAQGRAKEQKGWIEWAENGKDPDKMPSKIDPIKPHKKGK